jgi:hypothetical protein
MPYVLPVPQFLHVCHKSENFVKLDDLLAYFCSRDYNVLMGEFRFACYRKWRRCVTFASVNVSVLEFLGIRELVKGADSLHSYIVTSLVLRPSTLTNQKRPYGLHQQRTLQKHFST